MRASRPESCAPAWRRRCARPDAGCAHRAGGRRTTSTQCRRRDRRDASGCPAGVRRGFRSTSVRPARGRCRCADRAAAADHRDVGDAVGCRHRDRDWRRRYCDRPRSAAAGSADRRSACPDRLRRADRHAGCADGRRHRSASVGAAPARSLRRSCRAGSARVRRRWRPAACSAASARSARLRAGGRRLRRAGSSVRVLPPAARMPAGPADPAHSR